MQIAASPFNSPNDAAFLTAIMETMLVRRGATVSVEFRPKAVLPAVADVTLSVPMNGRQVECTIAVETGVCLGVIAGRLYQKFVDTPITIRTPFQGDD